SISGRPYAIGIFQTQYRLFAASGQSAMLQLAARPETGFVTEVDSSRMLFLGPQVPLVNPSGKPRSARIPSTPASGPPEPLVEPFDGPSLARFVSVHPALPAGSPYELFELLETVTVDAGSAGAIIMLNPPTTVVTGPELWIFGSTMSPEFVAINNVNVAGDTVTLSAALTTSPNQNHTSRTVRRLHQRTTTRGTTNQVLLDDNAQPFLRAYENAEIEIGGSHTAIKSYDSVNRVVELESAIGANLDPYRFRDQWSQLQDPA